MLHQLRLRLHFLIFGNLRPRPLQVLGRDTGNRCHIIAILWFDEMHAFRGSSSLFDIFILDADGHTIGSNDSQIIGLLHNPSRDNLADFFQGPLVNCGYTACGASLGAVLFQWGLFSITSRGDNQ